jgi:hypothetical protein
LKIAWNSEGTTRTDVRARGGDACVVSHSNRHGRPDSRAGRAWLPLLILGLAVLLSGLWWWSSRQRAPQQGPLGAEPAAPARVPDAPGTRLWVDPDASAEVRSAPTSKPTAGTTPRFVGRGRVRGSCDTPPGITLPEHWTVVLEPSRSLIGSEHAEHRRLECSGTQEFALEDLPLGGYDVRCEAAGMNGLPVAVLLEQGSSDPYVLLLLSPAGSLEGELVDGDADPLEDVPVALEPLARGRGPRVETRTDARGRYRFERVLDGEYRLHFGRVENPITPARELAFQAPGMTFPRVVIDGLHTLSVRVKDDAGRPVQGARVHGNGSNGGTFEGETDVAGEYRARHLRDGRVRVRAERAGFGSAFEVLEFGSTPQRELELVLRPQ